VISNELLLRFCDGEFFFWGVMVFVMNVVFKAQTPMSVT